MRSHLLCVALGVLHASTPAGAHEFWLQPERFGVAPGQRVALQLRVGSGWPGEVRARDDGRLLGFSWVDALGEQAVAGRPGAGPAGTVSARSPGPAWAVYRSNHAFLTLDAGAFEAYLKDEGLEHVMAARAARGETGLPGREAYARCAKALLQVGPRNPKRFFAPTSVGLRLELVPLQDPQITSGSNALSVRLLFEGQPLAGALVKALPRRGGQVVRARTDDNGVAMLAIGPSGAWLLNAVHMVRAGPDLAADWESIWSSLTFERAPAPGHAQTRPVKHDALQ